MISIKNHKIIKSEKKIEKIEIMIKFEIIKYLENIL